MNQPRDPKYASAKGPVNRRTALRNQAVDPTPTPARVRQQVQSTQARQLLGAPLSRQLGQQPFHRRAARPLGAHHAVLGLAPFAGLAGAWIGWQHASAVGLAAGASLLLIGAVGTVWGVRAWRRARPPADAAPAGPVFDPQALAQLDRAMELMAPQLPADTLARLAGIKATLVRMAPLLATAQPNEHFTVDDRLYVAECVRRYLPDSLQGWLQVPAPLRDAPGEADGPSAQALLDQQLDLLQAELRQREHQLGRAAAEPLLRQQRFLKAKHGGG